MPKIGFREKELNEDYRAAAAEERLLLLRIDRLRLYSFLKIPIIEEELKRALEDLEKCQRRLLCARMNNIP